MITYEIRSDRSAVFFKTCAIVAIDNDGQERFVCRYLPRGIRQT